MFDIGFWELALIAVVALLVVGPERLPSMARNVGLWVGRIRRYVQHVKDDIEEEIRSDELKKMLNQSDDTAGLGDVLAETRDALSEVRSEISAAEGDAEAESEETPPETGDAAPAVPEDDPGTSEPAAKLFESAAPTADQPPTTDDERSV